MPADHRETWRAAPDSPDAPPADASPPRWGAVGYAAVEALRHRAELAALEAAEARDHVMVTGALVVLAAGLALLAGLAGTLVAAWLVRNQPAGWVVVAGLALLYLGAAAGCLAAAWSRMRRWRPFQGTSAQLRKDSSCLQTIMHPAPD